MHVITSSNNSFSNIFVDARITNGDKKQTYQTTVFIKYLDKEKALRISESP